MTMENNLNSSQQKSAKIHMTMDLRIITGLLLCIILVMLAIWKPWSAPSGSDRVINVTGEATLQARPDRFVFYPSYEFKNADKNAALSEVTKKSNEVVAKLKSLGVADKDIVTNSDGRDDYLYYPREGSEDTTYTLRLTVTVADEKLVQEVQDYLITTTPTGGVSPQASFSKTKQKELQTKARNLAGIDARKKAEQSAKEVGFKLGKVKKVSDLNGSGTYENALRAGTLLSTTDQGKPTDGMAIQPGENDLNYSIEVTYYIR